MSKTNTPHSKSEQLVLEFLGRAWGLPHDLSVIDQLMTEDYTITSGGKMIKGRNAFKQWVKDFQSLLTDAVTINQQIFSNSTGELVVSRWACSGKNNGIFGLPPDGQDVSFTGIAIWKIRNGKLAECWVERSAFELYRQLNVK